LAEKVKHNFVKFFVGKEGLVYGYLRGDQPPIIFDNDINKILKSYEVCDIETVESATGIKEKVD